MRLRIVTFLSKFMAFFRRKTILLPFFIGCLKKNLYICGKFKILTVNGENYWKRA